MSEPDRPSRGSSVNKPLTVVLIVAAAGLCLLPVALVVVLYLYYRGMLEQLGR
jgi:hypothetical protein